MIGINRRLAKASIQTRCLAAADFLRMVTETKPATINTTKPFSDASISSMRLCSIFACEGSHVDIAIDVIMISFLSV